MKKFFTFAFIIIFSIIFLALQTACTGSVDETSKKTGAIKEKSTIRFAHWSTSSANVIEQTFAEYNKKNDNINVEIIKIPSDEVDETINLMFTTGQAPDIFGLNPSNVEMFALKGWVEDLTPFVDIEFLNRFPDYAIKYAKSYTQDKKFYTIASIVDTYRLIYNRDLFKKAGLNPDNPPKTLAEVRDYAKTISNSFRNENIYGFALPAAEDWPTYSLAMEYPASSSGLYYFNRKEGKYDLTVFKPWIQFFIDMKNDGSLFPGEQFLKNDTARMQFAEGNIGMMFAGSWDPSVFDSQFPAKCDWDVALPPALDTEQMNKGALTMEQGWSWGVNANAQHLEEAVSVWKFLYSDEFLGELFRNGCVLPIVNGIRNNPEYEPALKNFAKFFPTETESPYPKTPYYIDENIRWDFFKDALTGKKTIDEGLKAGSQFLNSQLEQAEKEGHLKIRDYMNPHFDPTHPMDEF